jgi:hypothetical protein
MHPSYQTKFYGLENISYPTFSSATGSLARVGLAFGDLHNLADKETDEFFLAIPVLLCLLGVTGDDFMRHGICCTVRCFYRDAIAHMPV